MSGKLAISVVLAEHVASLHSLLNIKDNNNCIGVHANTVYFHITFRCMSVSHTFAKPDLPL